MTDQGGDARKHRGVSVTAGAAGHPGRHLDLLHPRRLLGRVLLGKIAIGDWRTALIARASLVVLFRWKVSNPLLVAATAIIRLIAFPLLKPEWVFVK